MGSHLKGSTVCQTCLAKGLAKHALRKGCCFANKPALWQGFLLCNQECLVKGLAAAQLLHIYIYISICPQSGMEKRCWTVCMHRFLAFLALKCNLLSIPAYLWSHFVFLSHFLAQTKHSHLFLFFGHQLEKTLCKPCKGHKSKLWQEHTSKPWKGLCC